VNGFASQGDVIHEERSKEMTLSVRDKIMYVLGVSAVTFDEIYFNGKTHKQIMDDLKAEFEEKLGLDKEQILDALADTNDSLFPEEFLNRMNEEINKYVKIDMMIKITKSKINNDQKVETTDE
jgi:hypothetical protein